MTEQPFPVSPEQVRLRLQFTASWELRETLSLLVVPERRQDFGKKAIRAVVFEAMVNFPRSDQFITEQEREYLNYLRGIQNLNSTQFSLQPKVRFRRDKERNLFVAMWPLMSQTAQETICQPPFYNGPQTDLPIGVNVRLSKRDVLPGGKLSYAIEDVRSKFGVNHPAIQAAGRTNKRMYVDNLEVIEMPVIVPNPVDDIDQPESD